MPYIDENRREELFKHLIYVNPRNAGDLNYCISTLIANYLRLKGKKYQYFNDVVGALESAKLEFYRRIVAPYENIKNEENGEVYYID